MQKDILEKFWEQVAEDLAKENGGHHPNNWTESDSKMTKIDGCWVYNQRLSGGKYHYKFIVDGIWITDPANTVKEYDGEGHINSVCMVK